MTKKFDLTPYEQSIENAITGGVALLPQKNLAQYRVSAKSQLSGLSDLEMALILRDKAKSTPAKCPDCQEMTDAWEPCCGLTPRNPPVDEEDIYWAYDILIAAGKE